MSVRVLVADDHAAIRSGLRLILEGAPDVEVVGEAADGAAAIANARALHPDVVLMDERMPGTDGIEATRVITGERLADVLVLTTFDVDEYVFGALRAGAAGFLLKTVDAPALLDAVRRVAAGEGVLAPEVTRTLLAAFVDATPADTSGASGPGAARDAVGQAVPGLDLLTDRERDVLACLGRACRTRTSPRSWASPRRPRRPTSRACSPSSARRRACRPPSPRAPRAWPDGAGPA